MRLCLLQFKFCHTDTDAISFRIARYLEPLAIAANVVQESFCRLDQVLLTFGFLLMQYRNEKMNEDPVGRDAIIASIEAPWDKSDQEVFVCYRTLPFNSSLPCFNYTQIRLLLTRLYVRFYGVQPEPLFMTHAYDFLNSKGIFQGLDSQIKYEMEVAAREVLFILDDHFHSH